jgi:EAL domain-containing protein (putative c-di-GMP-specific phosphodiesterase class I)
MGLSEKEIQEEMAAMRAQFNELAERYAADAANARLLQQQEQMQMQQQPIPAEFPITLQGAPAREHFNFLLEPIIDLTTNRTAHYRVRFSITAANGIEIDYSKLTVNADRGELRPTLDVHVINQAIPLLRRLRAKHPAMRMFIPMGAATLVSQHTIAMVTQMLSEADNVAQGVVFELTHESLAGLSEAGISGLAAIARMGATLALTEASIAGLDLPALRHLGVKFIGIEARSIEPGWLDFVQVARGMQLQLLLTNVENAAQAASASQIARLVAGHFFAPPRRVKINAGMNAPNDLSAAA